MDTNFEDLSSAVVFLKGNPVARDTFNVLSRNLGISGYGIARQLGKNPTVVEQALTSLKEKNLIASDTVRLDGNFTLSGVGFKLNEYKHEFGL